MHVTFLGGAGEYGRSSFLLHTEEQDYLIDCGIAKSQSGAVYPEFDRIDPERLKAVFFTHSHDDHTGALGKLAETGWSGPVYASAPTIAQTGPLPDGFYAVELNSAAAGSWNAVDGAQYCFGRAGHTEGACWFLFDVHGETVFFSGDYSMCSTLYPYDLPPEKPVDLALMDGAYGLETRDPDKVEEALLQRLRERMPAAIHGPLSGKTQELLVLLTEADMKVAIDPEIRAYTLNSLKKRRGWYRAEGAARLEAALTEVAAPDQHDQHTAGLYLEKTLASGDLSGLTLFTTGPKLSVFESGPYEKVPFFVHPLLHETKALLKRIQPVRTVFTHTSAPEVFLPLSETCVVTAGVGDTVSVSRSRTG
ncbi:MBL fold metallo-hydrolase [Alkalicoccus luteus]|uniref:MBL fold metallo-hydrolase n=1 Tax=Alkalicoccus luteus TaxID=1237094 RepID=A0A969PV53_9BACI|nr:MBL fold metallo-hydrolase [Alkalicoccus luteus]NJP36242.1 MBL fold metallo-hydrolase [Alkalicoccus luteus]